MLLQEIKQLKTSAKDLRKFGIMIGGVCLGIGLWFWWRHKPSFPYFAVPGVFLVAFGLALPAALKWVYIGWMSLALILGLIVSTVLLAIFFYLVVTPIGFLARCCGKDFLHRKLDRHAQTYWRPKEHFAGDPKDKYKQQF